MATSLLRNWEQEVETHVEGRGFGSLIRLYGGSLGSQQRRDAQGTETQTGLPLLNLDWLDEAFEDGRAHRYWLLTTYTKLANYQHSLGKVHFSAIAMDEIQNIKNRSTLASKAVEAMNADFRIGLSGTPIENATIDLGTIIDRIAPGCLGSGVEFRERYARLTKNTGLFSGAGHLPRKFRFRIPLIWGDCKENVKMWPGRADRLPTLVSDQQVSGRDLSCLSG